MITAEELTKQRGGRAVGSDVTFRPEPGTITGFSAPTVPARPRRCACSSACRRARLRPLGSRFRRHADTRHLRRRPVRCGGRRGARALRLLGFSGGGPTAIEYAARNPQRVTQLVLYGTWARSRFRAGERQNEQARLMTDLMRAGWGGAVPAFRQVFSSTFIPSASEEQKRWYDELQQVSSTGEMAARLWKSHGESDVSDTAPRTKQPALVLHARQDSVVPYEEGRRLASLLPDARFMTLDSANHILQEGEPAWNTFLTEVRAFLGADQRAGTATADLSELSEREREVLELVAAGMGNDEIAERLFLSTRTVERHLSNIYVKLRSGKSARAAAAARYAQSR